MMFPTSLAVTASLPPAVTVVPTLSWYAGANVAGMDFDYTRLPGNYETNYTTIKTADINYLVGKGMNHVFILVGHELLQPTAFGEFNPAVLNQLRTVVEPFLAAGVQTSVRIHNGSFSNFAAYYGSKFGTANTPGSILADFWRRMWEAFKNNANSSKLTFSLNNEPTAMGTMQWFRVAQECIDAIRKAGCGTPIFVPGNGFTAASSWTLNDPFYDTGATSPNRVNNATGFLTLQDPLNNLIVEVHSYWDADKSGSTATCTSPTQGSTYLAGAVAWARANGKKIHVSEWGVKAGEPNANAAAADFIAYCGNNLDVIIGWDFWTYGLHSWWGGYQFTLSTSNFAVDNPQMLLIRDHFSEPVPPPPFSPSDVPNMFAWYDAADAVLTGGLVNTLANKRSGAPAYTNLTAKTASGWTARPLYTASDPLFNNRPTISADSATQYGRALSSVVWTTVLAQPTTWFAVVQRPEAATSTVYWRGNFNMFNASPAPQEVSNSFFSYSTFAMSSNGGDTYGTHYVGATGSMNPSIVCCVYNGASSQIYINRSGSASATGGIGSTSMNGIGIGNTQWTKSAWKFAEQICYSRVLTATERANVMQWLSTKYGIALTG